MKIIEDFIRSLLRKDFVEKEYLRFEEEVNNRIKTKISPFSDNIIIGEAKYDLPNLSDRVERNIPLALQMQSEDLILSYIYGMRAIVRDDIYDRAFRLKNDSKASEVKEVAYLRQLKDRLKSQYAKDDFYKAQINYHQNRLQSLRGTPKDANPADSKISEAFFKIKKGMLEPDFHGVIEEINHLTNKEHPRLMHILSERKGLMRLEMQGVILMSDFRYQLLSLAIGLVDTIDEICESELES